MPRGATHPDHERYVRTILTGDGPVVLAPFIGATWTARGRAYRRRRRTATAFILAGTVLCGALSAMFVAGLARPHTATATVLAAAYASTVLGGVFLGRRWIRQAPSRPRWADDGVSAPFGFLVLLLVPVAAGFGIAVLPALFAHDFPGEGRARALTSALAAR
ncbi:hypothetical protein AB0K00_32180 [Dactylosporangium sp. NPDC049525]|uniref:hypothetical protein n=1 Tax=Dactylosporangium sp. NPDC049525 TaxID=3154730 RepID=UPI0034260E1E